MRILFEPVKLRDLELRNRFVRSATYDGLASKRGLVTDEQIKIYSELAGGGVALIITGITYVHPSGQVSASQNSIASNDCIPSFKRLTAVVHSQGAKIAVQLFHAGREAARFLTDSGKPAMAPSHVGDDPYFTGNHRTMTDDEICDLVSAFGDAARRARESQFDAVQLHGAHAYLFSQFLSPHTNRRKDCWGGTLENRLRFHRAAYKDMRAKVGDDFPILIKVGVRDEFPRGLRLSEGVRAAQLLAESGFDALEISQGLRGRRYEGTEFRTGIAEVDHEGYFRGWSEEVRRRVDVPVMAVGGFRTPSLMADVILKGGADFISLCRPLIREPQIINAWREGDTRKASCVSCNKCLESLAGSGTLRCMCDRRTLAPAQARGVSTE